MDIAHHVSSGARSSVPVICRSVTSAAASADLGAQIRGSRTRYIGYAAPEVEGERVMCCFQDFGEFRSGGMCVLDHEGNLFSNDDRDKHDARALAAIEEVLRK